jgi:hypothetical protein
MEGPVFFNGADVEIHSPFVQFWSLEMVKPEKVGIKVAKVFRRHLCPSQSRREAEVPL